MADFSLNTPIETSEPTIEVTVSPNNTLRLGRHRFQLVVTDDSGNQSIPDAVEVRVIDTQNPTAVLTAPQTVPFSNSFTLLGRDSSDVGGGRVVRYTWTYLGPVPDPPFIITPPPIGGVQPLRPGPIGTVTPTPR